MTETSNRLAGTITGTPVTMTETSNRLAGTITGTVTGTPVTMTETSNRLAGTITGTVTGTPVTMTETSNRLAGTITATVTGTPILVHHCLQCASLMSLATLEASERRVGWTRCCPMAGGDGSDGNRGDPGPDELCPPAGCTDYDPVLVEVDFEAVETCPPDREHLSVSWPDRTTGPRSPASLTSPRSCQPESVTWVVALSARRPQPRTRVWVSKVQRVTHTEKCVLLRCKATSPAPRTTPSDKWAAGSWGHP